jgi:ABC-2 type transport system ATP-binding protein
MLTIIEVKRLTKFYHRIKAVDNVSFDINKGEIFGFLGPNGAGKSTIINILCTLITTSSGKAYVNGWDVKKHPQKVRQSIDIVFQDPSLDDKLIAEENLTFHGITRALYFNRRL